MKNDQPNKAEERWRESVREQGCVLTGSPDAVIHHCVGRTAIHNKVDIGHWWILPLDPYVHSWIHEQGKLRKHLEKMMFELVLHEVISSRVATLSRVDLPPEEVIDAIFDYHR